MKNARGFTLPEMIVYIALMTILLVGIIDAVNLMLHSYNTVGRDRVLVSAGESALSRMEYEVRRATAVATSSMLNADPSDLILTTTGASGTPQTVEFSSVNGALFMTVNGGTPAALLPAGVTLTGFIATATTTVHAQAATMLIVLHAGTAPSDVSFHDAAVLRGSYH